MLIRIELSRYRISSTSTGANWDPGKVGKTALVSHGQGESILFLVGCRTHGDETKKAERKREKV
jgi:hypothetical protein